MRYRRLAEAPGLLLPVTLALLACGNYDVHPFQDQCSTDSDCPSGNVCMPDDLFGVKSCHAYASNGNSNSNEGGGFGGTGGSGGSSNAAGAGGLTCGGLHCVAPVFPGVELDACCYGTRCGAKLSTGVECIDLHRPGNSDPSCPAQNVQGWLFAGCCTQDGVCGISDQVFGCVDAAKLGGAPGAPCGADVAASDGDLDTDVDAGDGGVDTDADAASADDTLD